MLAASVERDPGATAVLEVGGASCSYGELWERSARVAGGLRGRGVARGDRVAIRLANGIDWVLAFFGTQMLGAVVVPVNTRFTEDEVAYVVERLGRELHLPAGRASCPTATASSPSELGPEDLAAIFYTSGTTGFPKGAMTSHENFLDQQRERLPLPVHRPLRRARTSRRSCRCRCSTSPAATAS